MSLVIPSKLLPRPNVLLVSHPLPDASVSTAIPFSPPTNKRALLHAFSTIAAVIIDQTSVKAPPSKDTTLVPVGVLLETEPSSYATRETVPDVGKKVPDVLFPDCPRITF